MQLYKCLSAYTLDVVMCVLCDLQLRVINKKKRIHLSWLSFVGCMMYSKVLQMYIWEITSLDIRFLWDVSFI